MTGFFVGVGAHRAGTAWLRDALAGHPQVAMPARPEMHFFDSVEPVRTGVSYGARHVRTIRQLIRGNRIDRAQENLDLLDLVFRGPVAYREQLRAAAGAETRIVGEITPGYALLTEDAFVSMRTVLDSPRVLFVLRDPLERYWSSLRSNDPEHAVRRFSRRRFVDAGNLARGDYRTVVPILDRVFGDDVCYLFFEDLFSGETLRTVARHLGVDAEWEAMPAEPVVDSASVASARPVEADSPSVESSMPEPGEALLAQFAEQYDFCRVRFGSALPESWRLAGQPA